MVLSHWMIYCMHSFLPACGGVLIHAANGSQSSKTMVKGILRIPEVAIIFWDSCTWTMRHVRFTPNSSGSYVKHSGTVMVTYPRRDCYFPMVIRSTSSVTIILRDSHIHFLDSTGFYEKGQVVPLLTASWLLLWLGTVALMLTH